MTIWIVVLVAAAVIFAAGLLAGVAIRDELTEGRR